MQKKWRINFATDNPVVMVGARMASQLESLLDDSKILRKTQDEKWFDSIRPKTLSHYYFQYYYY